PPDVGQRHKNAEKLLARMSDAGGILAQEFKSGGIPREIGEDGGDGVNDSVPSSGENEVGKTHHLLAGECATAIFRFSQGAEKIVSGVRSGTVESGLKIVLEGRPFFHSATDTENVNPPPDPGIGFVLGHVEQVGESAGLQR